MIQPSRSIYNLDQFDSILFNGFNFKVPQETIDLITKLSTEVGSPTYIKTPVFDKKEGVFNVSDPLYRQQQQQPIKKKKGRNEEITNDDWESIRLFNETVINKTDGVQVQIQQIKGCLNKLTDKTYTEISTEIMSILKKLILNDISSENMTIIGNSIFEIASNNRFYSKLYANIYSEIITTHKYMEDIFRVNYEKYILLFDDIECADPSKDYERFCEVTKQNETRKAISMFFINLSLNGMIKTDSILFFLKRLFEIVLVIMKIENKKSEVDEIVEIISILYNKSIIQLFESQNQVKFEDYGELYLDGKSIILIITQLAATKNKTYPSLSSKSIFKFMDLKCLV